MPHKIKELTNFDKPLVVFDLETTGLSISTDKIVQIAYLKILPNGRIIEGDLLVNPEMEISTEAAETHGITNEMVADKPTFKELVSNLWEIFDNCYYSGFNIARFDLPLLRREFIRAGYDLEYSDDSIIDTKIVYHYMEPRTLSAAYKYYCNKEHVGAHSALADTKAAAEILSKQLEKYGYDFIKKIHENIDEKYVDKEKKFYWRDGEAYFAFSRYKDKALSEVAANHQDFLNWMMEADFSKIVKNIVKKALLGEFPKKNEQLNFNFESETEPTINQ